MSLDSLNENTFLERFVSQEHINCNDHHFWHQLLSCSFNFMRAHDARIVEKALEPFLVRLAMNNEKSLNTGSLVRVFLDRVGKIKYQQDASSNLYYLFQAFNALYILRCICKQFVENLTEEKLVQNFISKSSITINNKSMPLVNNISKDVLKSTSTSTKTQASININNNEINHSIINNNGHENQLPVSQQLPTVHVMTGPTVSSSKRDLVSGNTTLEQFMTALIEIIVDIPLSDSTYQLHVESINTLIILLSIQMYQPQPLKKSIIYRCLMQKKCSIHSLLLTKTLLFNFIKQLPMPQESGSIIFGLASGLWNVLTLGYSRNTATEELANGPILAKQSLYLLNILTNHCTTDKNPYREAIISCQDSRLNALGDTHHHTIGNFSSSSLQPMAIVNSIKIDFSTLYETICKSLDNDQVALLLYLLLHRNYTFKSYVMSVSSGLSKLVLPLLKVLYTSMEKGSHHVYMVLIILLILSEESIFNEAIHEINIKTVNWYLDRNLNDISLACLVALIVIRSIQYNIFRMKDKFLHTNLFAMLANLSNHFKNLDPYVCQRLVDVLERLVKRYSMSGPAMISSTDINDENRTNDDGSSSVHEMEASNEATVVDSEIIPMANLQSSSTSSENDNKTISTIVDSEHKNSNNIDDQVGIQIDDNSNDVLLYEEVIRMLLEVTNNCLVVQLKDNPDLIYTLLYKKSLFETLKTFQAFHIMVINIEKVLTFFYNRIEESHQPEKTLTVGEIKHIIASSSREWPLKNPKISGGLKFRYVEDDQPEEFFIPYIWTRIYYMSGISWNPDKIVLFNPNNL